MAYSILFTECERYLTAIILNISIHSIDWWQGVLPPTDNAAPIAADAAGAVVGAVLTAANNLINTGEIDAGSVATGAVLGAVSSSIGAIPKVTSLFRKLAKVVKPKK